MKWYIDAGHQWLAVSLKEYPSAADYSTGFGYIDEINELIYLEGDVEAPAFINAKLGGRAKFMSQAVPVVRVDGMAKLRTLPKAPKALEYDQALALIYGKRAS